MGATRSKQQVDDREIQEEVNNQTIANQGRRTPLLMFRCNVKNSLAQEGRPAALPTVKLHADLVNGVS